MTKTIIKFDKSGKAWVSERDFFAYVEQSRKHGDYYVDGDGITSYYNCAGCLLARYNQRSHFGVIF